MMCLKILLWSICFAGSVIAVIPYQTTMPVSSMRQITTASLNQSPHASLGLFKITEPGYYFVATDLVAPAGKNPLPIIYIGASNVVLDLGAKSITAAARNQYDIPAAISIAAGVSNIVITNGTINGKNELAAINVGIYGVGGTAIYLDNLRVLNTNKAGLLFSECSNVSLSNIQAYATGYTGLNLAACRSIAVSSSSFNGCKGCGGDVAGIKAYQSTTCSLENVISGQHQGTGVSALGVQLIECSGFAIKNLDASDNNTTGIATVAGGIDLVRATGNSFAQCSVSNNVAGGEDAVCFGIRLSAKSKSNTFSAVQALHNKSNGIFSSGFVLQGAHNNTFDLCQSFGNYNKTNQSSGFYSYDGGMYNFFRSCKANANHTQSGAAFGFKLESEQLSSIIDCEASANHASEGDAYGIGLLGNCVRVVVEGNSLFTNMAKNKVYGFKDEAPQSSTLLRRNTAFGHGPVFVGGTSSIEDSGRMNFMLAYGDASTIKNLQFVIKEGDIASLNAFESNSLGWFNFSIIE